MAFRLQGMSLTQQSGCIFWAINPTLQVLNLWACQSHKVEQIVAGASCQHRRRTTLIQQWCERQPDDEQGCSWGQAECLATTCAGAWYLAQSLGPPHPQPDWQKAHKMALHKDIWEVAFMIPIGDTWCCSGLYVLQPSRRHPLNDWRTKHDKGSDCTKGSHWITNALHDWMKSWNQLHTIWTSNWPTWRQVASNDVPNRCIKSNMSATVTAMSAIRADKDIKSSNKNGRHVWPWLASIQPKPLCISSIKPMCISSLTMITCMRKLLC